MDDKKFFKETKVRLSEAVYYWCLVYVSDSRNLWLIDFSMLTFIASVRRAVENAFFLQICDLLSVP